MHEDALAVLLRWLDSRFSKYQLIAAGHRVVHGGAVYKGPVRIDAGVVAELTRLVPLAPLHEPHNLAAIAALGKLHPTLPQVACFDTSFHHTQPEVAAAFALPRGLSEEGVRRYGFHGLSYEYIASVLPHIVGLPIAQGRVVVAHLGSGASMCAMKQRKSVATTMGFTALDGLVMSRRCGSLDPGVVLYLMEEKKMTAAAISDLLYQSSGLLGVSGLSDDMKTLLASDKPYAAEAVDLFVYRICRELGSLAAALNGLDALVFTAGIGEHAPEIRRRVCTESAWLGLEIDVAANEAGGPRITRTDSKKSGWGDRRPGSGHWACCSVPPRPAPRNHSVRPDPHGRLDSGCLAGSAVRHHGGRRRTSGEIQGDRLAARLDRRDGGHEHAMQRRDRHVDQERANPG